MDDVTEQSHVAMDMRTSATIVIRLDDGSKVGFNGGPLDWNMAQWFGLDNRLRAMTSTEACAHLDAAGWTRYHAE